MSQHFFCPSKSHTTLSLAGSLEVQDKENNVNKENNEQGCAAAEVSVKIQQTYKSCKLLHYPSLEEDFGILRSHQ